MSKKVLVDLQQYVTYKGVAYAPGAQEMPEDVAKLVVRKKLGTIPGEAESQSESQADFAPLSLEETMSRFQQGDPADEVFESLRFHQKNIIAAIGRGAEDASKLKTDAAGQKAEAGDDAENSVAENSAEGGKSDETEEKTEIETEKVANNPAGLPENFPMRHVFDKLGFNSVAEIQAKTREELIALNGIAEATADKALNYGK